MQEPKAPAEQGPSPEWQGKMSPEVVAEAAVWIARLHGPDRSHQMDRECLAWQARSAAHRLAFERCTDTWQDVAGLTLRTYARAAPGSPKDAKHVHRGGRNKAARWIWTASLLASVAVLACVLMLQPWRDIESYATGIGEQRLVILRDGTRMTLNTATHVKVELAKAQRTVNVEGGEALFEVAKDANRPFVVKVAGAEVIATGTAFVVRLTPGPKTIGDALAVTLLEGQVVVRNAAGGAVLRPVVMTAGERVRLGRLDGAASADTPRMATQVDRPRIDQVLAWKRGEALFDDLSLLEAVAEMNRYSSTPIRVDSSAAASGLRVSGLFRTGDSVGFARAVAKLHGLVLQELPVRLSLVPGSKG